MGFWERNRRIVALGLIGVGCFGSVYTVQRDERETAEHKVCLVRKAATTKANGRAEALKDVATAVIEASENGKAIKGYVVPQSIYELKHDKIELAPEISCP